MFFFFKQKTAYEMRISDWSSDVVLFRSALLGDIVLAAGVVAREAAEKQVTIERHVVHLIVHGVLHLLGYDHEQGEVEAEAMEALERGALADLGKIGKESSRVRMWQ